MNGGMAMSWKNRRPTIKIIITSVLYNKLLSLLESNISLNEKQYNISETAIELKRKLLIYSIPTKYENDNNDYVEIGFFPNEAANVIRQLIIRAHNQKENTDYYKMLVKNREKFRK